MKIVSVVGYDLALRERIVAVVEDSQSVKETARLFSTGPKETHNLVVASMRWL